MVKTFERIMTQNDCYKSAQTMTPKGCMIHSTGANNPNVARYVHDMERSSINNWNKSGLLKCVHGFIGKYKGDVVYCHTLPYTMRGWHCGGTGNACYIGIEICEDNLTNMNYLIQCLNVCAEIFAGVCVTYNLDPLNDGVIISHHEGYMKSMASNHADIDHWLRKFNLSMEDFRSMVASKYIELTSTTAQDNTSKYPEAGETKWYDEDWTWCTQMGFVNGKGPEENLTRAQMATIIRRLYDKLTEPLHN